MSLRNDDRFGSSAIDALVAFLSEIGVLQIVPIVPATPERVAEFVAGGAAAALKFGTRKLLVDHRQAEFALRCVDIYEMPAIERANGGSNNLCVAFLVRPDSKQLEDFSFYETRAYNVGLTRRIFTKRESALDWLAGLNV